MSSHHPPRNGMPALTRITKGLPAMPDIAEPDEPNEYTPFPPNVEQQEDTDE